MSNQNTSGLLGSIISFFQPTSDSENNEASINSNISDSNTITDESVDLESEVDNDDDDVDDSISENTTLKLYLDSNCLSIDHILGDLGLFGNIQIKEIIGKGSMGKVYKACMESDCDYVLKVTKLGNRYKDFIAEFEERGYKFPGGTFEEKWANSLTLSQTLPSVYAKVKGAWLCRKSEKDVVYGITIVEKFDVSALDAMTISDNIKSSSDPPNVLKKVLKNVKMQFDGGVLNVDNHLENFMINMKSGDLVSADLDYIVPVKQINETLYKFTFDQVLSLLLKNENMTVLELIEIMAMNIEDETDSDLKNFLEVFMDYFFSAFKEQIRIAAVFN